MMLQCILCIDHQCSISQCKRAHSPTENAVLGLLFLDNVVRRITDPKEWYSRYRTTCPLLRWVGLCTLGDYMHCYSYTEPVVQGI